MELSIVYENLSGHVHSFQIRASAVTILKDPLSLEHRMLLASTLYNYVKGELYPPKLQERFDEVGVEALTGSKGC